MRFGSTIVAAVAALSLAASGCAAVGDLSGRDLGDEGDPVHLTVGYQPYYTEAWTGVIMRGKEFRKKYLPEEFLDTRPDAANGWLRAELDAQRFLADPANADEIVRLAQEQTEGFSDQDLRDSLYREWPTAQGGSPGGVRLRLPFVPTGDSAALVDTAAEFLYRIKSIPAPDLPEGAVDPELATTVLDEAGIDPAEGVGAVVAGPGR